MSPYPQYEPDENEPDENEPDENEPDEDEGGHHTATTATTSPNNTGGGKYQTITGSPTNANTGSPDNNALPESSSNNNSVPASTIGPVIAVLVVVIVLATCGILHCARVRKRINDQTNTQSINGWTSYLQFKSKKASHDNADEAITTANDAEQGIMSSSITAPTTNAAAITSSTRGIVENNNNIINGGGTWRKPVKKRDYDRAFHYRMSKPPPLTPCDTAPTVTEKEYNNQQEGRSDTIRKSKEQQPSIVFSPGWLFAWNNKENEMESQNSQKHLINGEGNESTPLPPPESARSITTRTNSTTITTPLKKEYSDPDRLCPHQVTVEESPPFSISPPVPSPLSPSLSSSHFLQKPHEKTTIESSKT
ncbi:hypothetical protein BDC45DRAFT_555164 [Circinella umbellata]|nr:hypothetical protein BDC45DRAFT_555164 [Circinella umbellata]